MRRDEGWCWPRQTGLPRWGDFDERVVGSRVAGFDPSSRPADGCGDGREPGCDRDGDPQPAGAAAGVGAGGAPDRARRAWPSQARVPGQRRSPEATGPELCGARLRALGRDDEHGRGPQTAPVCCSPGSPIAWPRSIAARSAARSGRAGWSSSRHLLHDRGVEAEVTRDSGNVFPILRQHSCPYYELAEADRAICALERKMFEKVLGRGLRISQCRLDGDRSCDFQAKPVDAMPESSRAIGHRELESDVSSDDQSPAWRRSRGAEFDQ